MAATDPSSAGPVTMAAVEQRLPWLLDRAGIGVAILDSDMRFVFVNAAAAAINGVEAGEHLGRRLGDVLPGIPEAFADELAECLRTGRSIEGHEVSGATPASATTRTWRVDALPVTLPPDARRYVAVVFTENSEQRRAERRLRQVIDGLFLFVGLCAPDGTLIEANETALKAGGLEPEEVLGKPFWDAYWWNHDPVVQQQLREAIERARRGLPSRYDVVVRLAGDTKVPIDFQLVPVIEDGVVVAIVPSGLDVSDRVRSSQRLTALAELSAELNGAVEADAITQIVLERGPAVLRCDFVNVGLLDDDAGVVHLRHPSSLDPQVAATWSILPRGGPRTPFHDALDHNAIVWVRDREDRRQRYPHMVADSEKAGLVATACVPFCVGGHVLGGIGVGWSTPVEVSEALTARLALLADICGQAVWRALRTGSSTALVRHLTRQLLDRQDRPEGLDIACSYLPALATLNMAGDWYDVMALDDRRAAVIVGDVVGHGVRAAAQMAVTKSTLRALVAADPSLASLIPRLARAHGGVGEFVATALIAVIDTRDAAVDLLSLGHHPAVLREASGRSRLAWGHHDAPIALVSEPARPIRYDFPPGSTLVMYTDGLIEESGEDPDRSIERLVRIVDDLPRQASAEELRRQIMERTSVRPRRDDVALVVVRQP